MYATTKDLISNIRELRLENRTLAKELGGEIKDCYALFEDLQKQMETLHEEVVELRKIISEAKNAQ